MSTANLTRAETADRARHVRVHSYEVDVDVRDAADPSVHTFPVTSSITLTSRSKETWLDFIGEVDAILVDGAPHPLEFDGSRITLTRLPRRRCTVTVHGRGRYSRTGEGL
ncbi:MAG TPA: aminopeptidase N, partial [Arachnia sp.]|nr:aminopeptidase N [Arachnia sp.]